MKKLISFLMVITLIAFSSVTAFANDNNAVDCYENFNEDYKLYAKTQCELYGISYEMFLAVAYNESRFTPEASHINSNGTKDHGLCQINDTCVPFLQKCGAINDKDDLYDVYKNIDSYIAIMSYHYSDTQDEDLALLRYQVGEGAYVKKYANGNLTNETHQRVIEIKNLYKNYLKEEGINSYMKKKICNRCGKEVYPTLNLHNEIGYGSRFDHDQFNLNLCSDCVDLFIDFLNSNLNVPVVDLNSDSCY